MNQKIFVNRTLNMKKIKYIGLDMDHTLVRYHTKNFESLVYQFVVNKLISNKKYPDSIRKFNFEFQKAIRGLVIDSKNGNILKLSRYGAIRQSYHGTKPIRFADQKKIYRSIYVDLKDPNYMAIDTAFSIAFCVLYSQLVDAKDEIPEDFPSYAHIALDVLETVDDVHADGSLKAHIIRNMSDFVYRSKEIVDGLLRYIRYGKKIFLLTNSEYYQTNLLLDYTVTPFLEEGKTWRDIFEYVIALAAKPRFFYDDLKFLTINPESGNLSNSYGPLQPGVYQGGNAKKFTSDLKINGDEILYIGDHIYGDILRLKKDSNWRTALVVDELGEEIQSQQKASKVDKEIQSAMAIKEELEAKAVHFYMQATEDPASIDDDKLSSIQNQITEIDSKITALLQEEKTFFNPYWGRVFRAGAEESYFAYQVDRFACVYMEKLTDLLNYPPMTYFRAFRRALAHDEI